MTASKVPAGYCAAKWVGSYDALTPDREILNENGEPTGETILGAFLVSGESVHVIPKGEADASQNWKRVSVAKRPKGKARAKQRQAARDAEKAASAGVPAKPPAQSPPAHTDPPMPPAPTSPTPGTVVNTPGVDG